MKDKYGNEVEFLNEKNEKKKFVFVCEFEGCHKEFSSELSFKRHQKIHLLSYSCEICGKLFGQNWDLKVHLRTHTKEKCEECEICKKRFCDPSTKRKHIKLVHENEGKTQEKNFRCCKCMKPFAKLSFQCG